MPELSINVELIEIYKYPPTINLSSHHKITIAKNICAVISEVHKAGYVFGDFNPRNIGVDKNTGLIAFLDTDSYHVTDREVKKVYRCNVCAAGYAAPELLEKCSEHISKNPNDSKRSYSKTPLPTFTQETDNFALAIHIFKLLNNGYTPFGGIKESDAPSQASPGTGDIAVRRDNYCFKPGNKPQSAAIPPINVYPQELAALFTRAFIIGKKDPKQRPSAVEWHNVLTDYEMSLISCSKNPLHQYNPKNSTCPLCIADGEYQISIQSIIQNPYPSPIQVAPSPHRPMPIPAGGSRSTGGTPKNKSSLVAVIFAVLFVAAGLSIIIFSASDTKKGLYGKSYEKYNSNGELEWLIELGNEPPGMIIVDRSPDFAGIMKPVPEISWVQGILHFRGTFSYDKKTKSGKLIYGNGWGDKSNTSMDFIISNNLLTCIST
jgi:serine/threonine protein kinase